jgi:hypothetical protein
MSSLTRPDSVPLRLRIDSLFRPSEAQEGDELYANGVFEFNITRLLDYIRAAARFRGELVALSDMPYAGSSANLNELTVRRADLSRPVILAEIAPGQYNLIDGHHRAARARRAGIGRIPAYRIPCPEHIAFMTSIRAYVTYIEYWNSKVDDLFGIRPRRARRARTNRA